MTKDSARNIYVAECWDTDIHYVDGLFSSEAKARAFIADRKASNPSHHYVLSVHTINRPEDGFWDIGVPDV